MLRSLGGQYCLLDRMSYDAFGQMVWQTGGAMSGRDSLLLGHQAPGGKKASEVESFRNRTQALPRPQIAHRCDYGSFVDMIHVLYVLHIEYEWV